MAAHKEACDTQGGRLQGIGFFLGQILPMNFQWAREMKTAKLQIWMEFLLQTTVPKSLLLWLRECLCSNFFSNKE